MSETAAARRVSLNDLVRTALELLDSLDDLSPDRLWLEEAGRRAAQIDAGKVELVPSEEVDRKARALLR